MPDIFDEIADAPTTGDVFDLIAPDKPDIFDEIGGEVPDLSKVKLSPYDEATMALGGVKPESGMESGTGLTEAMFGPLVTDPLGSVSTIAGFPFKAIGAVGADILNRGRMELAASGQGDPRIYGPRFGESPEQREERLTFSAEKPLFEVKATTIDQEGRDLERLLSQWSTPESLAMLPAGISHTAGKLMLAQMLPSLPGQIEGIVAGEGTDAQKRDQVNNLVAMGVLMLARHAKPDFTIPKEPPPLATGAVLQPPAARVVPTSLGTEATPGLTTRAEAAMLDLGRQGRQVIPPQGQPAIIQPPEPSSTALEYAGGEMPRGMTEIGDRPTPIRQEPVVPVEAKATKVEVSPTSKSAVVDTIAGKMDLTEFEYKGYAPEQVTRQDWIELQRAERRRLGQDETNGNPNAPWSDYEEFHKQSVVEAIRRGEEVDPEVLKDYPDLQPKPAAPVAAQPKEEVIPSGKEKRQEEGLQEVAPVEEAVTAPPTETAVDKTTNTFYHGTRSSSEPTGIVFWSTDKGVASTYSNTDRSVGGGLHKGESRIIERSISPKNPLDLSDITERTDWSTIKQKLVDSGIDEGWIDEAFDSYVDGTRPGIPGILDSNWSPNALGLADRLKSLGFDSVKITEDGKPGLITFEPAKSPFEPPALPVASKAPEYKAAPKLPIPKSIPFGRLSELRSRQDSHLIVVKPGSGIMDDYIVKRYASRKALEAFLKTPGKWSAVVKNPVEKNMLVNPAFEVEKPTVAPAPPSDSPTLPVAQVVEKGVEPPTRKNLLQIQREKMQAEAERAKQLPAPQLATKAEMLDRLEKEQSQNKVQFLVRWVENGKNQSQIYSTGQAANEFALDLQSKGFGGIRIDATKAGEAKGERLIAVNYRKPGDLAIRGAKRVGEKRFGGVKYWSIPESELANARALGATVNRELTSSLIQPTEPAQPAPVAAAKVEQQVQKVAATEGQRPAKEVKEEYIQRVEEEINSLIKENDDAGNVVQKSVQTPDAKGGARWSYGSVWADVSKTDKGNYEVVTSADSALRSSNTSKIKLKATFKTLEEAEWFLKAVGSTGKGKITVDIPGDGITTIYRHGPSLIDVWQGAKKLEVKSGGKPAVIPTGERGKIEPNEIAESAKKLYGDNQKAISGIERQLASEQEMEPGQRFLLERAAQLLREDTIEFKRQKRIDELKESISSDLDGIKIAEERLKKIRSEMKSSTGTANQRQSIREQENLLKNVRAALPSKQAEFDRLVEAQAAEAQRTPTPPTAQGGGGEMVGMGGAVPGEFERDFRTGTGIKKAEIEKARQARGAEPADIVAGKEKQDDVHARVMSKLDQDPAWPDRLVAELSTKPRNLSQEEVIVLDTRYIELQDEYRKATKEGAQAQEDGRLDDVSEADRKADYWEKKLNEFEVMARGTGTSWGRTGAMMQRTMKADFSFEASAREERKLKGRPLTKDEADLIRQEAETHSKASEALQKHLTEKEAKVSELTAKLALEAIDKEALKQRIPDISPKVLDLARKWVAKWDAEATQAMNNLIGKSWSPTPEMLLDLAKVARGNIAHIGLSFAEWSVKMGKQLGEGVRPYLQSAWDRALKMIDEEAGIPEPVKRVIKKTATDAEKQADLTERITEKLTTKRLDEITPLVQKLARQFADQGVRGWRGIGDAVHGVLKELIPDLDYRDTLDAISGHGKFTTPNQAEGAKALKDAKDQIQIIRKTQEVIAHEPVKPTGFKRDPRSDIARRLNQIYENAKRRFGVVVTDPATQLRSALQSRKTYYEHRISDLQSEIKSRKRIVKTKAASPTDPALDKLISEYNLVKAAHDEIFGALQMTDAQRVALEVQSLDRQIAEVHRQLKEGDIFPGGKTPRPTSAEIEARRANLEALKAERENLRESIQPRNVPEVQELEAVNKRRDQLQNAIDERERQINTGDIDVQKKVRTPEATQELQNLRDDLDSLNAMVAKLRAAARPELTDAQRLTALKASLLRRTADAADRLARGNFAKKTTRGPVQLDSETMRLRFNLHTIERQILERRAAEARRMQSGAKKALRYAGEVINTFRAMKTSFDLSAVLRQGVFIVFGHPIRAVKALPAMFKALVSEREHFAMAEEIRNRPNAPMYEQAKLYLAEHGGRLSQMEEAYMSRWADKIPGVRASGRAYTTFLNKLRADSFDAMAATLSKNGQITLPQAKIIANYINVATGRGSVALDQAAVALNTAFFAPRYVVSRFQLLSGQPLWGGGPIKGQAQVRSLIAFEYARFLAGASVVYSIGLAAGATVETDPRSSDFGKLKVGNTRVDPMAGLIQSTVLASRLISGETKSTTGKITPIRGDKVPFGSGDASDVVWRFLRSKLSPAVGETINITSGKDVVGNPVTVQSIPARLVAPIGVVDIYQAMKAEGIDKGSALAILSIFGMGLQTHEPKTTPFKW